MAHREHDGSARWTVGLIVAAVLAMTPAAGQLAPIGDEFEVTTETTNSQNFPAISSSSDGFVIVWSSGNPGTPSADGDSAGVFGQRFASDGSSRGTEFQVNTYTTGNQRFPSVAASPAGDFVAVWEGNGTGGSGAHGQRYDASGVRQGTEFQVTTDAFSPRVARDDDGSFIVAWWGGNDGGPPAPAGAFGVFARRYDSGGSPIGNAFQVNTYTPNQQRNPGIALTTGGAFVIVWQSDQDGGNDGIYAQRYTSTGTVSGSEFLVNTYTTGFQTNPTVAADDAGNFVVAWQSDGQDASSNGVFAQRFSSSGTRLGTEFQVNTYTQFDQSLPDVDMDGSGRFVVTWGSTTQDGAGRGVFVQEFAASGAPLGSELLVNTTTAGDQDSPVAGAIGSGSFVVAWDAGASGVFAQRYVEATPSRPPSPTPTVSPTGSPTRIASGCPGDCNGSDIVLVNEVVSCVAISLENAAVDSCAACDDDGSSRVTIDELVRAVNALLRGCPS